VGGVNVTPETLRIWGPTRAPIGWGSRPSNASELARYLANGPRGDLRARLCKTLFWGVDARPICPPSKRINAMLIQADQGRTLRGLPRLRFVGQICNTVAVGSFGDSGAWCGSSCVSSRGNLRQPRIHASKSSEFQPTDLLVIFTIGGKLPFVMCRLIVISPSADRARTSAHLRKRSPGNGGSL